MTRYDIINEFVDKRNYNSFLEIGTFMGDTFSKVNCNVKQSVDPDPKCKATYVMTSDDYFDKYDDKFDIIFIDGLHEHNQVYRDIQNSLNHLNENGTIVMHDCMPKNEKMQLLDNKSHQNEEWTGDTWKAYYKALNEVDYNVYVVDTDYGCGIIDTSVSKKKPENYVDMEKLQYNDYLSFINNKNNEYNIQQLEV